MAEHKFSMKEAVKFGWGKMKENLGFFIGLLLVVAAIYFVMGLIQGVAGGDEPSPTIGAVIIGLLIRAVEMIINMGLIAIAIKFADNTKGEIKDLFSQIHLFFKFLLSSICYGLIVVLGLVLLIVPGIIWAIKYQFYGYLIIDKGLGPIQAIKESGKITYGAKTDLFLFDLVLLGINILGALALLVGLFATVPTSMVAYAYVYRKLQSQAQPA